MTGSKRHHRNRKSPLWRGEKRFNRNRFQEPTKDDLQGELIAFRVLRYEPDYLTRYGSKPKVVALLNVLTGPLSGEQFPDWSVVGPMAEQMASCPRDRMTGARVVTRSSENDREYVAIDLVLTAADRQSVHDYIQWISGSHGEVR